MRRSGGSCGGGIRVAELVGLILLLKRNLGIKLQPSGFWRLPTRTSVGCVCACAMGCVLAGAEAGGGVYPLGRLAA